MFLKKGTTYYFESQPSSRLDVRVVLLDDKAVILEIEDEGYAGEREQFKFVPDSDGWYFIGVASVGGDGTAWTYVKQPVTIV